jgi:hydrogenase/urease accessory protein HupE
LRRLLVALGLLAIALAAASPVAAHRLDEYLQATTITLARDHVGLELRLTPGVSVAKVILAAIDTDQDGQLSTIEQHRYAAAVQQDLRLVIDGQSMPLTSRSVIFPAPQSIRDGVGDIDLEFFAALRPGATSHALILENHHHRAEAVYLVNTLLPADARIQVTSQDRAIDQSSYHLDFTTDAKARTSGRAPERQDRATSSNWSTVVTFFENGVHHILTGYDHLLFVAALVLGAASLWDLVKVVTAFTVAHSITLTLAVIGWVHLPPHLVEAVISASIVFVAVQNLAQPRRSHGVSRLVVAFLFGLFHGLGFAGGLMDLMHAMPQTVLVLALVGFSLGVEAGNQVVLLPLYAILIGARRFAERSDQGLWMTTAMRRIGSGIVAAGGVYFLGLALLAPT